MLSVRLQKLGVSVTQLDKVFCHGQLRRNFSVASANMAAVAPQLRDYQKECIDKCLEAVRDGKMRIGVSLATGGGKTVIFSNLLEQFRQLRTETSGHKTALILVHRRELAIQAASTIAKFLPGLRVHMEMGKLRADLSEADVVIGSVLTMVRRLDQYDPEDVDLIVIDEAHHAVADSYIKILSHFNADTPDTRVPVIGFSATFERADKKALSAVMDEIIYHKGILEMIDENWLCEGKFTTVNVGADLSEVKSVNSDFQLEGLSRVMNTKEINEIVLKTFMHKQKEHQIKSTLLFAVDVAHCKSLFETFQKAGINAQYVTGKTRVTERDSIVNDFKNGKIQVLMNCGIFTEGTDMPNIDCILLCRPTKSRSLMVQMIGRGLRKHHTKRHCQIIDFVSSSKVGVVSVPSLTGIGEYDGDIDEATMEEINAIRQELEEKKLREEMVEKEKADEEQRLKSEYKKLLLDRDVIELTLTNFEDFKSFCESMKETDYSKLPPSVKEAKLLSESRYPWVSVSKQAWCFPMLRDRHIRLEKEKDESKLITYSAKIYRRLRIASHGNTNYAPYHIVPIHTSQDLQAVLNGVESFLNKITSESPVSFTKFGPWRKQPSTAKQKKLIESLFDKVVESEKEKYLDLKGPVEAYVANMSKGEASSLLFATSLAPKYPIKRILRLLALRNTKENSKKP